MSALQKLAIVFGAVLLLVGGYYLYSSRADTTIGLTLTTNPDLERGLVGHWTFDGPDVDWSNITGEIRDRSGNAHHGNATSSMTTHSVEEGVLGQALRFNGVGDFVSVADDNDFTLSSAVTVATWVRADALPGDGPWPLIKKRRNANDSYQLNIFGDNTFEWMVDTGADVQSFSTTAVEEGGEWYHVVGTWDGAFQRVYVNGTLEDTDAQTGSMSNTTETLVFGFGTDLNVVFDPFAGSLDDVRVYNRALSAEEVKRLYQLGATTKIAQTLSTNPTLETGLVGHWTFDGNDIDWSSTTAEIRDRSGNDNHGNALGALSTRSVTEGVLGQALSFDDSSGALDRIQVVDDASLDITGALTIATWIWPDNLGNGVYDDVIMKQSGVTVANYWFDVLGASGAEYPTFLIGNGSGHEIRSLLPLTLGQWNHMVVTYNDAANTINFYVNGVEDTTGSVLQGTPKFQSLSTNSAPLQLGGEGDVSYSFGGKLDDIRIYNRTLSAEEVKRLYQLGATTKVAQTITSPASPLEQGLVGHWTFDGSDVDWGSSTAEIRDRSGNNNHANASTTPNARSVTEGVIGQALEFAYSATSSYAYVNDSPTIQNLTQKTICSWIHPRSYGNSDNDSTILQKEGWYFQIADDEGNNLYYQKSYLVSRGTWRATNPVITLNEWQHVCVSHDASSLSNDPAMYVNGVSVAVTETLTPAGGLTDDITNILVLGNYSLGGTLNAMVASSFDGYLDDIRLYNRILSPDEIKRLYELGQ